MEVTLEPTKPDWPCARRPEPCRPGVPRRPLRAFALAACVLIAAPQARASWTTNAPLGIPVSAAPGDRDEPRLISDGAGGAIVVWIDAASGKTDVYAQHILVSGQLDPAWPAAGVAVCTAAGDQSSVVVVPDGAGGAIVAWSDLRNPKPQIYAQHVLGSGTVDPAWPRDGRPISTGAGHESEPVATSDGRGGAIVVWQNLVKGVGTDIYGQHVPISGAADPAWPPEGRVIGGGTATQTEPVVVSDGMGGAIAVWRETRGSADDLYGQRVLAGGMIDPEWPDSGRVFCSAPGKQADIALVADGKGGALVGWLDLRTDAQEIYLHHLTSAGVADSTWPADGLALGTEEGEGPGLVSDGLGGALVGWSSVLSGERHIVHVRRLLASGAFDAQWPEKGRTVGAGADAGTPSMVSDGAGGVIVVWADSRDGGRGIYAHHILASGAVDPAWQPERRVCAPQGDQRDPTSIADGGGGVISFWTGPRGEQNEIYGQRVNLAGVVGPATALIAATALAAAADSAAAPDSLSGPARADAPEKSVLPAVVAGGVAIAGAGAGADKVGAAPQATETGNGPAPAAAAAPAADAVGSEPRPALRAGVTSRETLEGIRIDGRLSEPAWSTADSIGNLTTTEPEEGGVPEGKTVVRVLVDAEEIVIGVSCLDSDPTGIVAFSKARDAELDEEDHVLIVIDTFGDGRSGYAFAINPSSSRFDGLVLPSGDDVNGDWDAVWEGVASHDSTGWSAEFRLPIKSLGFRKGLKEWGFNVERRVQRLQETSRWSGAKRDYQIWQMSRAGTLGGLPDFDLGRGLTVQPAWVSFMRRAGPNALQEEETRLSLDVRKQLGSNLTTVLTYNTDFGEAETDVRQTNLSRFDVLYPERRDFFLEGSDIFEFGSGLNVEDAEIRPFFSRRIGFVVPEGVDEANGVEVPIQVGGKLQGHIGEASIGALAVGTDPVPELGVPASGMAVLRLRRNMLTESSAGLIATFGGPLSQGGWTQGIDLNFKTSEFAGDKNLAAGLWGLATHQAELGGDRNAYGGTVAYPNDPFGMWMTMLYVGEDFDPQLGFVQRNGGVFQTDAEYKPRPRLPMVRQTTYAVNYFRAVRKSGQWESELLTVTPLDWLLTSGDRLSVTIEHQGDQPDEPFEVFEAPGSQVTIPAGTYKWNRHDITATLASKRRISGEFSYASGGFYEGRLRTLYADVILQPLSILTFQIGAEQNVGKLPEGDFKQHLESLRTEFKPSPKLQLTHFMQYDNESRSLGSASRLRWSFHPLGDLFLNYNHNTVRTVTDPRWEFLADKASLKVQYAFRR